VSASSARPAVVALALAGALVAALVPTVVRAQVPAPGTASPASTAWPQVVRDGDRAFTVFAPS
jgi:hypothetical protein